MAMKIVELRLETHCLEALKTFYTETLELPLASESKRSFAFRAGASTVHFFKSHQLEEPFYHFAFNIPENLLPQARQWLASRAQLIGQGGKDQFHFESWNADALYFYDPAGNIVEFIARHNLNNRSAARFSAKSILGVSEIGYPVEDVRLFSAHIRDSLNLKLWDGDETQFAAVGDEEGMFIIVPLERIWFPTDKPADSFPVTVDVSSE